MIITNFSGIPLTKTGLTVNEKYFQFFNATSYKAKVNFVYYANYFAHLAFKSFS